MPSILRRLSELLRAQLKTRLEGAERPRPEPAEPAAGSDPELAGLYANLEVPYGADLESVRQGWKQLVRKYHPDLHGADLERQRVATELVKGLNQAFERLRRHLEENA